MPTNIKNEDLRPLTNDEGRQVPHTATDRYGRMLINPSSAPPSLLSTTPTHSRVEIGDSSAEDVLNANTLRRVGFVINNTDQIAYIKEGADAVVGEGFPLYPNRVYNVLTIARVSVIKASGGNLFYDALEAS